MVMAKDKNGCQIQRAFSISEDMDAFENIFSATKVYPNPTSEYVNLEMPYAFDYVFELYDINGKRLLEQQKTNKVERINLSSFTKGVYLIKLKTQIDRKEFKLVIE